MQAEQDRRERVKVEEEYKKQILREQQEAYERVRRERAEEELRLAEIRQAEERAKEEQRKKELAEKKAAVEEERRRKEEEFKQKLEEGFLSQESPIYDAEGNRWIKCEFCGKIDKESEFQEYGGKGRCNLGTCRDCSANDAEIILDAAGERSGGSIDVDALMDDMDFAENVALLYLPDGYPVAKANYEFFGLYKLLKAKEEYKPPLPMEYILYHIICGEVAQIDDVSEMTEEGVVHIDMSLEL